MTTRRNLKQHQSVEARRAPTGKDRGQQAPGLELCSQTLYMFHSPALREQFHKRCLVWVCRGHLGNTHVFYSTLWDTKADSLPFTLLIEELSSLKKEGQAWFERAPKDMWQPVQLGYTHNTDFVITHAYMNGTYYYTVHMHNYLQLYFYTGRPLHHLKGGWVANISRQTCHSQLKSLFSPISCSQLKSSGV